MFNDRDASTLELRAAIENWTDRHNQRAQDRVRTAIRWFRAWHREPFALTNLKEQAR